MIDREHELAIGRQAELLQLSRSSLYYEPRPVSPTILALMRRIDELHLNYPFAGSRMLRDMLRADGVMVGREMARVDHDGGGFLHRGGGRGSRQKR
jgi:putative transposase